MDTATLDKANELAYKIVKLKNELQNRQDINKQIVLTDSEDDRNYMQLNNIGTIKLTMKETSEVMTKLIIELNAEIIALEKEFKCIGTTEPYKGFYLHDVKNDIWLIEVNDTKLNWGHRVHRITISKEVVDSILNKKHKDDFDVILKM